MPMAGADPTRRRRDAERTGRLAESLCVWLLRLKAYRVLARDLRTPVGEIDIVARRGRLVVAIEVKRRAHAADAMYAVQARQRRRIERAFDFFLARHPDLGRYDRRFDIMTVSPGALPRHFADAWRPE